MFTINNITKRFDLDKYFTDKLSGADLKASKPHPEIFINAAKAADALPNECFVIEDSTNGIKAAKRAGIYCVAYKSEHSKNQDYTLADMLISDYKEITFERMHKKFN
jgi:beta-phosphoglucomutase-like phosphatase (HAD superfamily)